jgi:hypothetical protein
MFAQFVGNNNPISTTSLQLRGLAPLGAMLVVATVGTLVTVMDIFFTSVHSMCKELTREVLYSKSRAGLQKR